MPIIRKGHRPTRKRPKPSAWSRRAHYLTVEHGRERVVLLDDQGRELGSKEAIARWSKDEPYHEVIVAPSIDEVRAATERYEGDEAHAAREIALRIGREIAHGRPFFVALHWDSEASKTQKAHEQVQRELREIEARHRRWGTLGSEYHQTERQQVEEALKQRLTAVSGTSNRWHCHLVIRGPERERLFGRKGKAQKAWDRLWADRPETIRDWEQHRRFAELREQVREIQRQQRVLSRERSEALRRAEPLEKRELARHYEERLQELIQRRYAAESLAMEARYAARGMVGCAEHRMEIHKAEQRRDTALQRMRRRYDARRDADAYDRSRRRSKVVRVAKVVPRVLDCVLFAAQLAPLPKGRDGLVAARAVAQMLGGVLREYSLRRR